MCMRLFSHLCLSSSDVSRVRVVFAQNIDLFHSGFPLFGNIASSSWQYSFLILESGWRSGGFAAHWQCTRLHLFRTPGFTLRVSVLEEDLVVTNDSCPVWCSWVPTVVSAQGSVQKSEPWGLQATLVRTWARTFALHSANLKTLVFHTVILHFFIIHVTLT